MLQTFGIRFGIVGKEGVPAPCVINHVSNANDFHIGSRGKFDVLLFWDIYRITLAAVYVGV